MACLTVWYSALAVKQHTRANGEDAQRSHYNRDGGDPHARVKRVHSVKQMTT